MTTSAEVAAKASFFTGVGAFPDAEVERAYQHAYFLRSLRPVRAAIALAIGLFILFSALDPFLQPDAYFSLWIVRLAIVVPILGALLAFTYTRRFESWFRPSQLFAVVFGGSALVYLGVLSSGDLSTAQVVGLLLAIVWAHSVSRLSFMLATSATVMLSLLYVAVELRMGRLPATSLLNNIFFLASANLIGMIASYSLEAGYRREFQQRALLEERRRELQGSLDRLHDAERRVSELELRAPDSLENLPRWAEQVSNEIRRTVEAAEVRIFRSADGKALALNDGDLTAPALEDVNNAGEMAKDASGNVLVPLTGLSGEVFGAIMIAQPASWSSPERGLVAGFARYLGGALEILEKRHELAIEEARRETARRQMRERGVGAMWLCPTCGRCFDDSVERCDVDGTRLVQRLLPYRIQGRYKLLRLLGQGGMGQVFLACDEKLQRDVAIKVLLGESPLDANARAQLAHEARAVARIGHPGVVDVFDLGELEDGSAFIVMEYLIGRALSEEIARHGRGSPRQVAELLRQVGAALAAAHRTGVVHRDIKPQNVFLTRHADGFHARLLDFGVARVAGGGADTTRSGALFGTPAYMAPEQIAGAAGDERSDLYSLAAVAFEALVGRRLIKQRPSVAATLAAILNEQPPDVSTFLKDVPADLDGLFRSALSRDPAARPPNVADWADAVAQRLDGMSTTEGVWPLPITHELTMRGQVGRPALSASRPVDFEAFGAWHLLTVATVAAAIAAMCRTGRVLQGTANGRRFEVALSAAVWALWLSYQAYDFVQHGFDRRETLPLQMCDFVAVFAALVFVRPTRRLQSLAYFWGLALSTQALITPDLAGGPSTLAFWWFWLYHLFVIGAGVYVVVVQGFRPEWPDLRFALLIGLVYAASMFAINAMFGLNYGYLGRATPTIPTLLDVLGPYPLRCVFMVVLGAAAMTALWLPWVFARKPVVAR